MSTFLRNKTISKTTPLRKENPFPRFNVASDPQMPRNQAFFWIHNNTAFRGRGRGKNRYSYDVKKNVVQVYNFLNSFVQDCSLTTDVYLRFFRQFDSARTLGSRGYFFLIDTDDSRSTCKAPRESVSGALSNGKDGLFHLRYIENRPLEPGYSARAAREKKKETSPHPYPSCICGE